MRNFDLGFGCFTTGPVSKNIENQLRAVDDVQFGLLLKVAQLRRREFVVNDHRGGVANIGELTDFFDFAGTKIGGSDGPIKVLPDLADNRIVISLGQFAKFGYSVIEIGLLAGNACDQNAFRGYFIGYLFSHKFLS